ncbi:hypothetical protein [Kiloniella majae]|jgi:hypothetical protein|uniref:hypothetical protein n=1 Tax=Kiloniella majae TaxID=1938558 RepID=UPI000A278F6D|nr:hypothetical protein [Kiloniella majae]
MELEDNFSLKNLAPALLLILFSSIYLAYMYFRPAENAQQIAVLFPPTQTFQENINSLDSMNARLVRIGYWDNLLIVDFGKNIPVADIKIPSAFLLLDAIATGSCFFTKT